MDKTKIVKFRNDGKITFSNEKWIYKNAFIQVIDN